MSDNPKSRGEEAAVSTEKKPVDMGRLLNLGKEVELSFGKFTVKELSVFDLISTLADGLDHFMAVLDAEVASELDLIKFSGSRLRDSTSILQASRFVLSII